MKENKAAIEKVKIIINIINDSILVYQRQANNVKAKKTAKLRGRKA